MFKARAISLLTKHGKEKVIAPVFSEKLDVEIEHTDSFDTDQLGTFTGEIPRENKAVECAIKKAELACELTGNSVGLGSEGSFFISPAGIGNVNEEMIACVNKDDGAVVVGRYITPADVRRAECNNLEELLHFVNQTPVNQGLVLQSNGHMAKGLHGEDAVCETVNNWFGQKAFRNTTISFDLRAHQSPFRRENIVKATENLIERLQSCCPECKHPGFWPDRPCKGLPCEQCSAPTNVFRKYTAECKNCFYQKSFPVDAATADAKYCNFCNP